MVSVGAQSHTVSLEDVTIVRRATGDLVVKHDAGYVAAIDPSISAELRSEGLARELVNRVQRLRKELGFAVSDRIELGVSGPRELLDAVDTHGDWIASEVLALRISTLPLHDGGRPAFHVDLDGVAGDVTLHRIIQQ